MFLPAVSPGGVKTIEQQEQETDSQSRALGVKEPKLRSLVQT